MTFPPRARRNCFIAAVVILLAASAFLRFYKLDTYPGINGDEAQMGVETLHFIHGEPYSFRTLSGLMFNPIYLGIESILFLVFPHSFFLLRFPAAICCVLGVYVMYALHRRVFNNRREAALAAVLYACLPLALAYARCAWDSTFMLLTAPLVLYPAMMFARGEAKRFDKILFPIAAILCLWVHVTSGLMLLGIAIAMLWLKRKAMAARVGMKSGAVALLLGSIALLVSGTVIFLGLCYLTRRPPVGTLQSIFGSAILLLRQPLVALGYLSLVGDFLSGARGYQWYAGMPPTRTLALSSLLLLVATVWMTVRIGRSHDLADRFVRVMWMLVPILLIGAVGRTGLQIVSSERYVLWLMPMFVILSVRYLTITAWPAWRAALVVFSLCAIFLGQFWLYYFDSLIDLRYQATLVPTFWTAGTEPKAQAAGIIRQLDPTGTKRVFADTWWIEHPMRFLLYRRNPVVIATAGISQEDDQRGYFVVAIAGGEFAHAALAKLSGVPYRGYEILGGNNRPVLVVIYVPPGTG
jgi:uncharacterized membrane protein